MRAVDQPHTPATVSDQQATFLQSRSLVAAITTVALLLVWRPALLRAQDAAGAAQEPSSTSHIVTPGETLWSLAVRYYGDGHQWQALARRNGIPISGVPPLKVGMRLRVPPRPTVRGATAAMAAAAPAESSAANLRPTTGTTMGERSARRIGLADQEAAMNSRKPSEVLTVFHRDLPDAAEAERRTRAVLRPNAPAPRIAEFLAAPFVTSERALVNLGRIAARVGSPAAGDGDPQRAIKTDEIELEAPEKQSYKVGDRLLAFGSPMRIGKGQVVITPTGILEVVKVGAGRPALALVVRQSGRIEVGQHLLTAPGGSAPWVKAVLLESPDVPTTIAWIDPQEAQPTLQSYVVIGAGSAKGLRPGDEVAIYRRSAKGTAETIAASARVVRVEHDFATSIVTKQYQTDIALGLPVRRFAKAP